MRLPAVKADDGTLDHTGYFSFLFHSFFRADSRDCRIERKRQRDDQDPLFEDSDFSETEIHKKEIEKKKKSDKKPKKDKQEKTKDKEKKKGKKKLDIVFLVRLLLDVVTALFKKLGQHFKIRIHAYEICVASEEAAKTAVMYGMVQTLSETLFLRLEKAINFKIVKNAPLGVYVDFLEEKPKANVKIDFSISIADVFAIIFGVIFAFIKSFISLSIKKNG